MIRSLASRMTRAQHRKHVYLLIASNVLTECIDVASPNGVFVALSVWLPMDLTWHTQPVWMCVHLWFACQLYCKDLQDEDVCLDTLRFQHDLGTSPLVARFFCTYFKVLALLKH